MTCVERRSRETVPETGRLSDGRVDGVEAARHRVDAIAAPTKDGLLIMSCCRGNLLPQRFGGGDPRVELF